HFFLNLSMAACKAALDAASGIEGSTVVTAMSRNGVDFGIRLSGTGDAWFTTPVGVPDGLFFPGYGPENANPDLGDSAITETFGIGGFAMAAAPAIVRFVGGSPTDALDYTRLMGRITLARNPSYQLPPLGFIGTPTGIDARRVVDSGIAPVINTGIAHKEAGIGQIGAGIARAPLACFA
ncbi:MAG: oxamate carbamoyltransferase subunit AllG family protein, partial [Candidatus Limnocylindrales bacterium]